MSESPQETRPSGSSSAGSLESSGKRELVEPAELDTLIRVVTGEGALGSQGDMDAPLADRDMEKPLDGRALDGVMGETEAVGQSEVDALIARLRNEVKASSEVAKLPDEALEPGGATPPQSPVEADPAASSGLPQGMADALAVAAKREEKGGPEAVGEKPPSSNTTAAGLLTQEDLDALLRQAEEAGRGQMEQPSESPPAAMEKQRAREVDITLPTPSRREAGTSGKRLRADWAKMFAVLAAAVMASLGAFTFLYTHQERLPTNTEAPDLATLRAVRVEEPVDVGGPVPKVGETLAGPEQAAGPEPLAGAPALTPEQTDAAFAQVAAACKALSPDATAADIAAVHDAINDFINAVPPHPKAIQVLLAKANLYKRERKPYLAREVYKRILAQYGDRPGLDEALAEAAKVALEVGQAYEAERYVRRLLEQYPDSAFSKAAQVTLAGAYAATGRAEQARALYTRLAESEAGTRVGADALVGLAKLAMDQGKYAEAVTRLEARVAMTSFTEGNDAALLLLGRAYRASGRLADARARLNDLLTGFPKSNEIPAGFVELSRVLDDLGMRPEAVQVARQAAQQYPRDAEVLRNEGLFLGLNGDHREAADVLMAADAAGLKDPQVLLEAARHFRAAETPVEAQQTYERLVTEFPKAAQALTGTVELAEVLFRQGMIRDSVGRLEALARFTPDGPQRLPVLVSLAKMYQDLGLRERSAEIYDQVATRSGEPEVLAQSAMALIDNGAVDEGMSIANRLDVSKVTEQTAYAVLAKQGEALLLRDPRQAVRILERAYTGYPRLRTEDLEQKLVQGFLATGDTAHAQVLVGDIETQVQQSAAEAPRLKRAAIRLGDYLYDRQEYRAAADTYLKAINADGAQSAEGAWAKYQRANALFKLNDFEGSAVLYDQVAASGLPCAKEASVKAEYARVEQRLRGLPITAKSETNPKQS